MAKLWQKSEKKLHPAIEKYTAGTDFIFDGVLIPYDVLASRAHASGLQKIGILTEEELQQLLQTFDALDSDLENGKISISPEDEDCHTVIENYLVEKLGDTGKKIHTGRSRNDQVAVAVRLYMKAHLSDTRKKCAMLASGFVEAAQKYKDIPMPGYSHTRQAMLTSVGHYFAAFAESLLDDAEHIAAVEEQIDKNPLGSAAGFGTAIPVDREFTAKKMGFDALQLNSLYVQNSRGKVESMYLECLAQVMLTLGRFSSDMLLFTSNEFGFFEVDASLTTGSSIMPHKHNLDALEIVRGNTSVVIGNQLIVKELAKNVISGYNRDVQLMKKPLIESTQIVDESIEIIGIILGGVTPRDEHIRSKIEHGIFTADIANELVGEGMPFRDAYKKAAVMKATDTDLQKNIESKKSLGAPGNLALDTYRARIKKML